MGTPHLPATATRQSRKSDYGSSFAAFAIGVFDAVDTALRANHPVQSVMEGVDDPLYLKSVAGQVVLANTAFDRVFGGGVTAVGRFTEAFLFDVNQSVAHLSDELLINGCDEVELKHPGRDASGRNLVMHSYKRSLFGCGHPRIAIFGITRIIEIDEQVSSLPLTELSRYWHRFSGLDARDRDIAGRIVRGEKTKEIAQRFKVTEKTIENRRNAILSSLEVENIIDLTKVMVRLQDNGFVDFGI